MAARCGTGVRRLLGIGLGGHWWICLWWPYASPGVIFVQSFYLTVNALIASFAACSW